MCASSGRLVTAIDEQWWKGAALQTDIRPSAVSCLHYQGDARDILFARAWRHAYIFAPCDDLALSGSQYFADKVGDGSHWAGLAFFLRCCCCPALGVLAEHPRSAVSWYWRKPDLSYHPRDFGPGDSGREEVKETCF